MPADRYLAQIVARALERQHRRDAENLEQHLDFRPLRSPRRRPPKRWRLPFRKPCRRFGCIVAGIREGCSRYEYPCPCQSQSAASRPCPRSPPDHRIGTPCAYPFAGHSGRGSACIDLPSRSGQVAPDGRSRADILCTRDEVAYVAQSPIPDPSGNAWHDQPDAIGI